MINFLQKIKTWPDPKLFIYSYIFHEQLIGLLYRKRKKMLLKPFIKNYIYFFTLNFSSFNTIFSNFHHLISFSGLNLVSPKLYSQNIFFIPMYVML